MQALSIRLEELKAEVADGETETVTEHTDDTEALVKGGTTFNDLLEWGLSVEEIEFVLGMEMGARSMTVRDFLMEKELEFSEYKEELQLLLDEKE